jgi:hypothetical protein
MCPCASDGRNGSAEKDRVELDIMRNMCKNPPHDKPKKRTAGTITPHAHRPIDIVHHEMLPCGENDAVDAFTRPHTWPKNTPQRPPPLCTKNIFINIDTFDEMPISERTPSHDEAGTEAEAEEWHTPRMHMSYTIPSPSGSHGHGTPNDTYCRVRRDSNENTFTFVVNSSVVKDVYVNYERVRSFSL